MEVAVVALALALAPAGPAAASAQEVAVLRLDVVGVDARALASAIQLRVPRIQVIDHDPDASLLSRGQLYVHVERPPGGRLRVDLVAADGRAFEREVDPGGDPPERVAAALIANLVFAIEAGSLAPDRVDVIVPGATAATQETVEAAGDGAVDPAIDPAIDPAVDPAVELDPPEAAIPRLRLGVGGALGALLGPGAPTSADVFAGWSGALAVAVRGRRGGLGRLQLRGAGRRAGDYGLSRLQVAIGGGYVGQLSTLEVEVVGALTIEPWWVTRGGAREPTHRGGEARFPWLLGGEVRAAIGHRFVAADARWRAGPFVTLGGAFTVADGVGVPIVRDTAGDPLFRAGAFELGGGAEVVVWFDRRAARRPDRRVPKDR